MKKTKIKVLIILILAITIFSLSMITIKKEETIQTNTQSVSNKKIGWGIKRNDNHEQPDVGNKTKKY